MLARSSRKPAGISDGSSESFFRISLISSVTFCVITTIFGSPQLSSIWISIFIRSLPSMAI